MRGDDARDALGLGLGFPDVAFISAADDDPVGARKHIAGLAGEGIADLGLRDQDRELAADRDQFHVAEQLARAEPGAVRSEEHTSELQSLMRISYAVFCLKKKKKKLKSIRHDRVETHQCE